MKKAATSPSVWMLLCLALASLAYGRPASATEVICYRCVAWKASHFENSKKAAEFHKALEHLGCEVKRSKHSGHIDVTYRCGSWISINAADHAEAHRWSHWLQAAGFETLFTEFASTSHLEKVSYQLSSWKAAHLHESAEADRLADTLKTLGCEVRRSEHDGHFDIAYRCPQIRTVALESDAEAHAWQDWMKQQGFETRHQHGDTRAAAGTPAATAR